MRTYVPWTLPELGREGWVTTVDTQYLCAALDMTRGVEPDGGWTDSVLTLERALERYGVQVTPDAPLHNAGNDAYVRQQSTILRDLLT